MHFSKFFIGVLGLTLMLVSCAVKSPQNSENKIIPQVSNPATTIKTQPKLVVGIVVDQMRYDYLTRFWGRYGEEGFKRLIKDGYHLKNAHYNYMPTYTAPGHASIYTGSTPRYHGIISNSFYDKQLKKTIVPVVNDSVSSLGTATDAGQRSPKYLLASTFGDENRIATQFKGKTIGISLKDRGSVLPAGHAANAAYWFNGTKEEGRFISSTYYMDELPKWVKDFNSSELIDSYLTTWETLYPIETYVESGPDSTAFEGDLNGRKTFPYNLKKLKEDEYGYGIFTYTPFGNSITTDFAIAAIDGEDLGADEITDILTISYSSTDYIGHHFGVNSKEIQDTYLRLDMELARLLNALDEKVGKDDYTLFLTADHAGVHVPSFLQSEKIAGGYFSTKELRADLKKHLQKKFNNENLMANLSNFQVFIDYEEAEKAKIDLETLEKEIHFFLMNYPGIAQVYTRTMIENAAYDGMISGRVKKGFHPKRSGDVAYVLEPSVMSYYNYGSSHGSPYAYDTHVPMIFYGKGINQGQSSVLVEITDIAPTISTLLGIGFPSASVGKVLTEVID